MKLRPSLNLIPREPHQIPNLVPPSAALHESSMHTSYFPRSRENHAPLFSIACALFAIQNFVYPHYFQGPMHSLQKTPRGRVSAPSPSPNSRVTPAESIFSADVPSNPFRITLIHKSGATPRSSSSSSLRTIWPSELESPSHLHTDLRRTPPPEPITRNGIPASRYNWEPRNAGPRITGHGPRPTFPSGYGGAKIAYTHLAEP